MREHINWSLGLWIALICLDLAVALAIGVALTDSQLAIFFLILLALTIAFAQATRLTIEVRDQVLYLGRAHIEARYIAEVIVLDKDEMRYERGTGLDPRAFLALRFWVPTGIKLVLKDQRDPTPYWLFSTRRSGEIKRALETN
jgi:hypothetical protein